MKGKGIIQLWGEFIDLGWSRGEDNRDLKDLELFPKVFLRKWKGSWSIHYLPIGSILTIPAPWPSIWSEFYGWLGGKERLSTGVDPSVLEIFAKEMVNLVSQIDKDLCVGYKYEDFDASLDKCIMIGTNPWGMVCKDYWGIKLPRWTILDINGTKEI